MVLSLNEFLQSKQWELASQSDTASFIDGIGNSLTSWFVAGLLSVTIGSALKIHAYGYFSFAYILGAVLIVGSLAIYLSKAKSRLLKIEEIFVSDIQTRNLLKARELIEHYEPKRAASISWRDVELAYDVGNTSQAIVPLIVALEGMRRSFDETHD